MNRAKIEQHLQDASVSLSESTAELKRISEHGVLTRDERMIGELTNAIAAYGQVIIELLRALDAIEQVGKLVHIVPCPNCGRGIGAEVNECPWIGCDWKKL